MPRFRLPARILPTLTLPALALLAGCTATPAQIAREDARVERDDARLARALAGYTAGQPLKCISPQRENTTIFGDRILYGGASSRKYLTTTTGGCFGLKRNDIIVTRSVGGQICAGDIVTTLNPTSQTPSGACSFGEFVPYSRRRD